MHPLARLVVDVPDFPQPGILFRDITPLLRSHFGEAIAALDALWSEREWAGADAVAGVESRGFILAAALAERRRKGFVPIRKKGKLPPPVVDRRYALDVRATCALNCFVQLHWRASNAFPWQNTDDSGPRRQQRIRGTPPLATRCPKAGF